MSFEFTSITFLLKGHYVDKTLGVRFDPKVMV